MLLLFNMEKGPWLGAKVLWLRGLMDARAGGQLSLYSLSNLEIRCFENKALIQKGSKGLPFDRW